MNATNSYFRHAVHALSSLAVILVLAGCHSTNYFMHRNFTVQTTPGASLFWEGGKFDGGYIKTVDDNGIAVIGISKSEYRRNKLKKIIIAKEGFEPQVLKLDTKFNASVLWSILFPPAFIWGKYTTLDFKGENRLLLSTTSPKSAADYWEAACSAKREKQKEELLRQALLQDPLNAQGIGIQAADQLSSIYFKNKEYTTALQYTTTMLRMNPQSQEGMARNKQINMAIAEKTAKKLRRIERLNKSAKGLQAFSNTLNANMATVNNYGTTPSSDTSSQPSASGSSKKGKKQSSVTAAQNERTDRRTYNNYVDQLSRMKTGLDQYNDTNRRKIQSEMRKLREKYNFPKDELEDWNGSK